MEYYIYKCVQILTHYVTRSCKGLKTVTVIKNKGFEAEAGQAAALLLSNCCHWTIGKLGILKARV